MIVLGAAWMMGGCSAAELSSLRDFACPYEGEYLCEYADHGGRDLLSDYREVILTLEGESFRLCALPRRGKPLCAEGTCCCDVQSGILTLRAQVFGKEYRKDLVLRGGKIFFSQIVAGKPLVLRFGVK